VGYAFSSLEELGDGVFRKIRPALEITAFGANAVVLAPGVKSRRELGPGGLCHVEATTPRQIVNVRDEDLVLVVVGAKDGYVGRDGQPADASQLG